MEIQKIYTPEDDVRDTTKEFFEVLSELCEHIKVLKMEQWELKEETEKSVDFINAYDLVIKNKVWILHKLVDGFSDKVKSMELLPKEEKKQEEVVITLPEVSTNVVSY
jgi:hypothetical protein